MIKRDLSTLFLKKREMKGGKNGGREGRKDGRMEGWKDGRMEGWKDGSVEGWKRGRVEEWNLSLYIADKLRHRSFAYKH